ncbi:hypothetical protein GNI_070680 [Gregarina niphandrodes]|uniref:Uncharacterized protein n=1 Tax=Gregarina niphandrodes TaxID=110365 RepID=A0A023B7C8_GRENI|nr:hypothetical protein GNI_070680 [Gregarina niphandrodes]EZG67203.1 hypothetical protein GNI_070680 [Gregarina niphandrodes]|eukprot:XP_011130309.1 hypothetical protein GNI_070680 [Gregarina niphandrodes]
MKTVLIIPPLNETPVEYLRNRAHEVSDNSSVLVGRDTLLQGESLNFSWLVLTEWPPDLSRATLDENHLTFDNVSQEIRLLDMGTALKSSLGGPLGRVSQDQDTHRFDPSQNAPRGLDLSPGMSPGMSHDISDNTPNPTSNDMSHDMSNGGVSNCGVSNCGVSNGGVSNGGVSNGGVSNGVLPDVIQGVTHNVSRNVSLNPVGESSPPLSPSKMPATESDNRSLSPSRKQRMSVGAAVRGIFGKVKSEGRKGSVTAKSGTSLDQGPELASSVGDDSFKMSSVEMSSAGQDLQVSGSGSASGSGSQDAVRGLRRHQSEFAKKKRIVTHEFEDDQTSMASILQSVEDDPAHDPPLCPSSIKKQSAPHQPRIYLPYDIHDKLVTADILTDLNPPTTALTQQLWESQSDPVEHISYCCQYIPTYFNGICIGCLYKMRLNITVLKNRLGLYNKLHCVLKQKDSSSLPDGTLGFLDGDAPLVCPDPIVTVSHPIKVCKSVELCTYLIEDDQLFVKIANVTEDYSIIIDSMNTRTAPLQEAEFPLEMSPKSEYVISVPTSLMRPTNLGEKRTWNELDHKTVFTLAIQWHIEGNTPSWAQHAADCRPHIPTPLQMTLLSCVGGDSLGSQLTVEALITNYENEPIDLVLLSPDVDEQLDKILAQCAPGIPYPSNIIALIRENLTESAGTAWSLSFQVIGVIKPRDSKRFCLSAWVVGEHEKTRFPSLFLLDLTHSRLILVEP